MRLAPILLFSFIVGCSDSMAPISLTLNRARWENQNLHEYLYTARRTCFCPDAGQDVYVLVLSDTVFSARAVGTNVELPKDQWNTVDQLFDLVERSFGENGQTVRVKYHPELGYPTLIEVQCPPNIADCGLTIEAKNLGGLVVN